MEKLPYAEKAESLLKEALLLAPDSPDLLNYLAGTYEMQGRSQESHALWYDIVERHPDYVFARVSVARVHLLKGENDAASALLKPILERERFHFKEFSAFCHGYLELLTAQNKKDAARACLNVWKNFEPDNPDIFAWQMRLSG